MTSILILWHQPFASLCRPLDVHCTCGEPYCFTCKKEAHQPVDCQTVQDWSFKNSSESENMTWIMANTKACPKCEANIEKNQGCMHMTCSQCRHEFCWLCLGKWSIHGDGTGGLYACNRCDCQRKSCLSCMVVNGKQHKQCCMVALKQWMCLIVCSIVIAMLAYNLHTPTL
jgi:hypothetical protein